MPKLAILGPAESGKTALATQLEVLSNGGAFSGRRLREYKDVIRRHLLEDAKILVWELIVEYGAQLEDMNLHVSFNIFVF